MNIVELQHILGIINYMAPFIPKLSKQTENLPDPLKKDKVFMWRKSHENVFQQIEFLMNEENTPAYFNKTRPTVKQIDASGNPFPRTKCITYTQVIRW